MLNQNINNHDDEKKSYAPWIVTLGIIAGFVLIFFGYFMVFSVSALTTGKYNLIYFFITSMLCFAPGLAVLALSIWFLHRLEKQTKVLPLVGGIFGVLLIAWVFNGFGYLEHLEEFVFLLFAPGIIFLALSISYLFFLIKQAKEE